MRATKITYDRLFNLGQYENERISIEVQIEASGEEGAALKRAREWVIKNGPSKNSPSMPKTDAEEPF